MGYDNSQSLIHFPNSHLDTEKWSDFFNEGNYMLELNNCMVLAQTAWYWHRFGIFLQGRLIGIHINQTLN